MSKHYSALALARHALDPDMPWPKAWESPEPKSSYDVVIIGGGGHGLATAYYLAKNHGITNVAVIEKSYIGSGNVGRGPVPSASVSLATSPHDASAMMQATADATLPRRRHCRIERLHKGRIPAVYIDTCRMWVRPRWAEACIVFPRR